MRVVTIAPRRSLPEIRVLAESLRATNPSVGFAAILTDLLPSDEGPPETFELLGPTGLTLPQDTFARMAFMYDEGELAAALRPWALAWALQLSPDEVVLHMAPDTVVLGDLGEVANGVRKSGVGLCPRRLSPVPDDGLRPSEMDLADHGWWDPGLLIVAKQAGAWLAAWQEYVQADGGGLLPRGPAMDRRWLDGSAALVDIARLSDPSLNVSYWNIDERVFDEGATGPTSDGVPVVTMRFDGFDPTVPWSLTSSIRDRPRVLPSDHRALVALLDRRERDLTAARRPQTDAPHYRFATFGDGVRVSDGVRLMYRRALLEAHEALDSAGLPPIPDPEGGFGRLRSWLGEPSLRMPRLTRLAYGIWASRADLQGVFPLPQTDSREAYADWLTTYGLSEGYLSRDWLEVAQPLTTEPDPIANQPGCNVFGYFSSVLGVGTSGRAMLDAARDAGLPTTVHDSVDTDSPKAVLVHSSPSAVRYPVNLVAMNADLFPLWVERWGPDFADHAYTVGLWAWELDALPQRMHSSVDHVDEIWALSEFNAAAFRTLGDQPVHVFPVPARRVPPRPMPEVVGLDRGRSYFLSVFDFLSEVERKNPIGLIHAYRRAFPDDGGPALVIKSLNGAHRRNERERVRRAAARVPGVLLIEDYLPAQELEALVQHAVAFVSLHRSEGFGLALLEAMSQGTPVIATAYSGNMDFMSEENSLLVPYSLQEVSSDGGYYSGLGRWAEPDLEVAARHLVSLADDRSFAASLGARAQQEVLTERTPQRAAAFVRARVEGSLRELETRAVAAKTPPSLRRRISTRIWSRHS